MFAATAPAAAAVAATAADMEQMGQQQQTSKVFSGPQSFPVKLGLSNLMISISSLIAVTLVAFVVFKCFKAFSRGPLRRTRASFTRRLAKGGKLVSVSLSVAARKIAAMLRDAGELCWGSLVDSPRETTVSVGSGGVNRTISTLERQAKTVCLTRCQRATLTQDVS